MKITQLGVWAIALALFTAGNLHAQNVGIGVANPQSKLSVNGTSSSGGLAIGDATYTSSTGTVAPQNGAIIQGTVGIGTSAPNSSAQLHIYNPSGNAEEILESSAPAPFFPFLRLVNDSTTNFKSIVEWSNAAHTEGFQWALDPTRNGTNDFELYDLATNQVRIYVDPTGNVGIGTITPLAPLHVGTTTNITDTTTARSYFFSGSSVLTHDSSSAEANNASAIFASTIWVAGDIVSYNGTIKPSDARLKNIIGPSDSAKDLEILKKIEVTDYTMKDTVKFGQKPFKKVIAQQVDEVYPTAVTSIGIKGFTFTPDIYAVSDSIKMEKPDVYLITLAKAHDLKDGDTVRLITSKNPELTLEAHVVNDKTFTVETKKALGDKVFVYGKECTDLKAVDYEAISMLNVSATQELAKKVEILEQQNTYLQNENRRLTAVEEQERQEKATVAEQGVEIAALKGANEKLTTIAAKMESLERAVAKMQEKGNGEVKTVALEQ
jgi:Chaperone of endosialidase